MAGFDFPTLMQRLNTEEKAPRTKEETLELLRTTGETWAGWLDGLSEDFLAEQVAMPPGGSPSSRSRFDTILSVKEHEMHHRGQLMLIERMLGIVPHLTRDMQARRAEAAAKKSIITGSCFCRSGSLRPGEAAVFACGDSQRRWRWKALHHF